MGTTHPPRPEEDHVFLYLHCGTARVFAPEIEKGRKDIN
jgi:hypothetical protein